MLTLENRGAKPAPSRQSMDNSLTWTISGTDDIFEVELAPYAGVDFSKQAFLFCGQGAMAPGVSTEGLEKYPVFQQRFRELDELAKAMNAGTPSEYITRPDIPLSPEQNAVYSGLCLYATQVAMFEALVMSGHFPKVMTAHSFGEFAMLTASGVVSFPDMVRFLIDRQRCLAEFQGQYTMFAVSHANPVDLSKFPFEIFPANYNTKFQTVFVCREKDYAEVKAAFRAQKLASVKMNIDFPYHTPWLEPVRDRLARVLSDRKITFHSPKVPMVSSVTHDLIDERNFNADGIRRLLVDQLVTPVQFPGQLAKVRDLGVCNFFELSPVDVLDDFVVQFFEGRKEKFKVSSFRKSFKVSSTSNKTYEKLKDSKFFSKLDSALKALTGYSVQQIRLEDRIREDLGIDSIKKAEIVFEIVDAMGGDSLVTPANLADLATFGDVLEYFETSRVAAQNLESGKVSELDTTFSSYLRSWRPLDLVDYSSVGDSSVMRIQACDVRSGRARLEARSKDILVLDTRGFNLQDSYIDEMKWWLGTLKDVDEFGAAVILIGDGGIFAEGLTGLLISLCKERHFSFKAIEVVGDADLSDVIINRERSDFYHNRVKYESGRRWVRSFIPVPQQAGELAPIKKVLAFGGMGGIGHHLLMGFADQPLATLVIVGRTGAEAVNKSQLTALKAIARDVHYESFDLAVVGEANQCLKSLSSRYGEFDLILHGVGVEISEPLDHIRESDIDRIMDGKIRLADALANYAKEHKQTKIVINSSIVSEFGSPGQCAYGAANSYLNELAKQNPNIKTILWPGWEGIGVASQKINARSLKLQGVTLMRPDNGQSVFKAVLAGGASEVAVMSPATILDFSAIGQNRNEFSWLMKPASRDYSLFVVPGLTQAKLPYLKDHLVKRACIFPASGSMAMMLFRAYLEKGELGNIRKFSAQNFLVVREESSNVTLETTAKRTIGMSFQVKSHQLLATGDVEFGDFSPPRTKFHFTSNQRGVTDYDQNVAVYTGPAFELAKESYLNSETNTLVLDVNLETAPVFIPIPLIDKVHRLIELSFNTTHAKALLTRDKFTVPKSIEAIDFYKPALSGHRFFTLIENLETDGPLFLCDIITLNEKGEPAIWVKGLRSIVVGESKTATTKGYRLTEFEKTLF